MNLDEGGLARVMKRAKDKKQSHATISAERAGKSKKENKGRSKQLEKDINKRIAMKWEMWLDQYAGGGVTAAPPSIAKSWGGPIKLGPFVHSTKYFGQAQSVGRRPHGYYVHGDFEGGPLVG